MKEIEIIEGYDPSSYFWIQPAVVADSEIIEYEDITLFEDEISIEETDVDCFLYYFFNKYFDLKLYCNKKLYGRVVSGEANPNGFEWYLTENFYTYDTMRMMLCEILEIADLLEKDFSNKGLDVIKKRFSIIT